ncbi:MAG: ATP-binding cassette domain-containing protein [Thermodesulfobacteriota bacterium]
MLALRELSFRYSDGERSGFFLINGVDLMVERGEHIAILGRNAAGKTTLARLIKGLLRPSSGQILVDGQPLYPGEGGSTVGLIFSNPDDQLLFPIVEEEMAFGLECIGVEREMIRKRIMEYLGLVGMKQFLSFPLHSLSKCQQQRVAIAAVLALEPHYLLLDHATSVLDPYWRSRFMSILSELNATKNMAVIHFTTSVEEASYAHLILVLENGELTAKYIPAEISSLRSSLLEKGYCLPPVAELSFLLEQMGHSIPPGILTMEEMEVFLLRAMGDQTFPGYRQS